MQGRVNNNLWGEIVVVVNEHTPPLSATKLNTQSRKCNIRINRLLLGRSWKVCVCIMSKSIQTKRRVKTSQCQKTLLK